MNSWNSVQESIQWIEDNLAERIEIERLAQIACLSPFYYQRLFTGLVGRPVMEYVRLRRLAAAADRLSRADGKDKPRIVDVAFSLGFENHETFTRAFKETYGLTPEAYRNEPRPLSHFLMPDLSLKYTLVDENVPLIANGVILEVRRTRLDEPRRFAGLSVQNSIDDTPGIDFLGELWDRFHGMKGSIASLAPGGREVGVSSPGEDARHFAYFAGAELGVSGESRPPLAEWAMGAGEYAVCAFEAENFQLLVTEALNKARDYMLGLWIPNHRLAIEPFMAELYFDTAPDASKMEIWLKIAGDRR